jgi:hypothetical protein
VGLSPIADDASDGARASSAVLAYFKWAFDPSVTSVNARTPKILPWLSSSVSNPSTRMIGCHESSLLSNGIRPNALSLWFRKTQHGTRVMHQITVFQKRKLIQESTSFESAFDVTSGSGEE